MPSLDEATAILERTPAALQGMLAGLPDEWSRHSAEGTWSAFDIVGHLIIGEKSDWMDRTRMILEEPERPFERFDREAMFETSKGRDLDGLLREFAEFRASNLEELTKLNLSDDDLKREGVHPMFGSVTLGQLIATWAVHDLGHTAQIAETMAKRYREDIGPWRRFLPVVDREEMPSD